MPRTAPALVLLLASAPALAAPATVVEATVGGSPFAQPVIVPVNFGGLDLGEIAQAGISVCFKQTSSPPGSCDAAGKFALEQNLGAPFHLAGRFRHNLATGVKTPVNFPVNLQAGQSLTLFTQFVPSSFGSVDDDLVLRGTPTGGTADDVTFQHQGAGMDPPPCASSSDALCLNNDRFRVRGAFLTAGADSGFAGKVKLTADTGYLYFFNPSNVEAVVKVLNACSFNNRYWVFAGGLTDVRTVITVTDTQRNAVRTYINPQGTPFEPIQDTSAFATCP